MTAPVESHRAVQQKFLRRLDGQLHTHSYRKFLDMICTQWPGGQNLVDPVANRIRPLLEARFLEDDGFLERIHRVIQRVPGLRKALAGGDQWTRPGVASFIRKPCILPMVQSYFSNLQVWEKREGGRVAQVSEVDDSKHQGENLAYFGIPMAIRHAQVGHTAIDCAFDLLAIYAASGKGFLDSPRLRKDCADTLLNAFIKGDSGFVGMFRHSSYELSRLWELAFAENDYVIMTVVLRLACRLNDGRFEDFVDQVCARPEFTPSQRFLEAYEEVVKGGGMVQANRETGQIQLFVAVGHRFSLHALKRVLKTFPITTFCVTNYLPGHVNRNGSGPKQVWERAPEAMREVMEFVFIYCEIEVVAFHQLGFKHWSNSRQAAFQIIAHCLPLLKGQNSVRELSLEDCYLQGGSRWRMDPISRFFSDDLPSLSLDVLCVRAGMSTALWLQLLQGGKNSPALKQWEMEVLADERPQDFQQLAEAIRAVDTWPLLEDFHLQLPSGVAPRLSLEGPLDKMATSLEHISWNVAVRRGQWKVFCDKVARCKKLTSLSLMLGAPPEQDYEVPALFYRGRPRIKELTVILTEKAGEKECLWLAEVLQVCQTLETLVIEPYEKRLPKGMEAVFDAIGASKSLKHLTIDAVFKGTSEEEMLKALENNDQLETISMHKMIKRREKKWAKALRHHPGLEEVDIEEGDWRFERNLSFNSFAPKGRILPFTFIDWQSLGRAPIRFSQDKSCRKIEAIGTTVPYATSSIPQLTPLVTSRLKGRVIIDKMQGNRRDNFEFLLTLLNKGVTNLELRGGDGISVDCTFPKLEEVFRESPDLDALVIKNLRQCALPKELVSPSALRQAIAAHQPIKRVVFKPEKKLPAEFLWLGEAFIDGGTEELTLRGIRYDPEFGGEYWQGLVNAVARSDKLTKLDVSLDESWSHAKIAKKLARALMQNTSLKQVRFHMQGGIGKGGWSRLAHIFRKTPERVNLMLAM